MKINLLLLAIVVIAGGIRLIRLEDKVLWLDEQHTVLEANGISEQVSLNLKEGFTVTDYKREKDIKHIARAVVERDSGNGIIYAYGMALWTGVFNNSSYSIRLVSVIFSLLTTGLLFYLGRDLFNSPAVGYWSAILFSIHHVAILKAQEARAYSMATFFYYAVGDAVF
ncbi:MAG: glycosyltransferase family 39 protein [Bacteroidota bacterium]